jgi:uncharacterized membrane protein YhhN
MRPILPIYLLLIAGDLIAISQQSKPMEYIFKPLLMLALGWYVYTQLKKSGAQLRGYNSDTFLLAALAFSWLGDVILMNPKWFIFGLLSFLIAHIFYILTFRKDNVISIFKQNDRLSWAVVILFFTGGLIAFLGRYLGEMKIPVMLYAAVITVMLLVVLNRWKKVNNLSFALSMAGAILFAFSDSMIAINKFAVPINNAGIIIMVTYAIGQWLIVEGYLKNRFKL